MPLEWCDFSCHPGKLWGFKFDSETQRWVCYKCNKPSYWNNEYVKECMLCGSDFADIYPFKNYNCQECI